MASFGANKNPPWVRGGTVGGTPGLSSQLGQVEQQSVFGQQSALGQYSIAQRQGQQQQQQQQAQQQQQQQLAQQQHQMALQQQLANQQLVASQQMAKQQMASQQYNAPQTSAIAQPGIAMPTSLGLGSVQTVSYPTPRAAQQPAPPPQQDNSGGKQRVFTGSITKLLDNFGFVDDDVFFPLTCVKGMMPKLGDRVLVESTYNSNMPFKWSATRIQVLPNQAHGVSNQNSSSLGSQDMNKSMAPRSNSQAGRPPNVPSLMSQMPQPQRGRLGMMDTRPGRNERLGRTGDRGADRWRDRDRRSPVKRERERTPARRSKSPRPRSPARGGRRSRVGPRYSVQLPKLSPNQKEAGVLTIRNRYTNMYIPSDFYCSRSSWLQAYPIHRPLSLDHTSSFYVISKDHPAPGTNDAVLEPADASYSYSAKVMLLSLPGIQEVYRKSCGLAEDTKREGLRHPTRVIKFLVGVKGKEEPLAIGGPWSAELDGANPKDDPAVLIRTAVRSTKALTGIDLSGCTQWYRFAEINYHRAEETHKGRHLPDRVETVVIFLPDVWNCMPSSVEYDRLLTFYKSPTIDDSQEDGDAMEDDDEEKTPTHFSKLDMKTIKVTECRYELDARGLNSKGMKAQLIARLTKVLKQEQEETQQEKDDDDDDKEEEEERENKEMETDADQEKTIDDKDKTDDKEKEKGDSEEKEAEKKKELQLPSETNILVHPSPVAKGGKFNCTVMSLSVLLDYRQDDNKEHSFEVSLFAELFNEMLMRDFGFQIYRSLAALPEVEDPKEKEKDSKDKDKKSDKEESSSSKKRKTDDGSEGKKDDSDKKSDDKSDVKKEKDDDKRKDSPDDDKKDDKHKDKEEAVAMKTIDAALLLSCVYFDLNRCDYLADKDAEEILHTMGLQISRSQVRKLVKKVLSKDQFSYRKLSDQPEVKEDEKVEAVPTPGPVVVDVAVLAKANTVLTDVPSESPMKSKQKKGTSAPSVESSMVTFRGATVDIASVLHKLELAESLRMQLEAKVTSLNHTVDSQKKTHEKDVKTIGTLQEKVTGLETSTSASEKSLQKIHQSALSLAKFVQNVTNLASDVETTVNTVLDHGNSSSTSSSTRTDSHVTTNGETTSSNSSVNSSRDDSRPLKTEQPED